MGEESNNNSPAMTLSIITSVSGEASDISGQNQIQIQEQNENCQPTATAPTKKKRSLPGMPDPDAEVIALSPKTLKETSIFVCEICNKGFQRDQNLQLHRRGHNLPWKPKQKGKEINKRVYICPEPSCVHHDPSRALGDLTGIKKHFCRKHGERKWKCGKCSKSYAVQADWKAHSKTCGTKEYRCNCGTLFYRKDSFVTHRASCDVGAEDRIKAQSVKKGIITEAPANSSCSEKIIPSSSEEPNLKINVALNLLDPDTEVIAFSPRTLMATTIFICEVCNKGFQREQNLQLHRRGHNLPWIPKQRSTKEIKKRVYVCPEPSCVHHDPSRALGDITGIKKHFRRKHGEKNWKCDNCSKSYAVQSDWKAHSKICGIRRESLITHRASCDAVADDSVKALVVIEAPLNSYSEEIPI